jgi:sugar/nucleoside kinase (ribokinase family)
MAVDVGVGEGGTGLDVVGIGALNVDYIVAAAPERGPDVEWGTETLVDADTVTALLAATDPARVTATPGGSALNTMVALAHLGRGLRLGYVGVAGRAPAGAEDLVAHLHRHRIDTAGVRRTDAVLSGVCVAVQERGERTLLTHPGANTLLAEHLDDDLLGYLSRARVVHVTSLLDPVTPGRLLRLLGALRRAHPEVLISVDPGHVWSVDRSADVLGIVALADVLLVNSRELRALAAAEMVDSTEAVVRKMMALMAWPDPVLLVKAPGGITVARRRHGRVRTTLHRQVTLRDDQIVDATGAGDVFAAGVLDALVRSRSDLTAGVRLGLALARHGMQHVGTTGHAGFAEL